MIIKLAPSNMLGAFYGTGDKANRASLVHAFLYVYESMPAIDTPLTGKDAAEEAFDLTNNPSRQEERLARYGSHRSLSVGDVVEVDGINYLCDSFGWIELVAWSEA